MLRRHILKEIVQGTDGAQDKILRVVGIADEPDQALDVDDTSITARECLVGAWVKQVDSVDVRNRECLVERELEEFVDHLHLLGRHLGAVIALNVLQDVDHRLEVDQVLALQGGA